MIPLFKNAEEPIQPLTGQACKDIVVMSVYIISGINLLPENSNIRLQSQYCTVTCMRVYLYEDHGKGTKPGR